MGIYSWSVGPLLQLFDAETAHRMAISALKSGLLLSPRPYSDPLLESRLWGLRFSNPVGLAAGFDKNGEVPDRMLKQGFGFCEIGTVTPQPQAGNPRPRLFRLRADRAAINRLGFNNDGAEAVRMRLLTLRERGWRGLLGVNIGINKDTKDPYADYKSGVVAFAALADYLVLNVSSPNTPGLRDLQLRGQLAGLLDAVREERAGLKKHSKKPLLIKIAPDLAEADLADIAKVALDSGVDGLIATNTTIARGAGLVSANRDETGGLSGRPLFQKSTDVLRSLYKLTDGNIPLIGVGGVSSGEDALEKIKAGASLIQLYTAMIFEGPSLVNRICRDLAALLRKDGFSTLKDAVGADHR